MRTGRPLREQRAAEALGTFPALTAETVWSAADDLQRTLPDRTRRVVVERFGLASGSPRTLADIGSTEGVSRERIRQIVDAGLALLRRAAPPPPKRAASAAVVAAELLNRLGGAASEGTILAVLCSHEARDRAALRFLLSGFPTFAEARETQRTYAHWVLVRPDLPVVETTREDHKSPRDLSLEAVIESAERVLATAARVVPEDRFVGLVLADLHETLPLAILYSYLALSKQIARNPLGEFGLRTSREAVPRSVGDKAYLILRRAGKPLHFREVAAEINRVGFDEKRALAETVHNELIRDARFVLVGRGLYALHEWGFTPGKVSDLIVRLLEAAGRPLLKQDLVEAVLKERLVRRNTVLMSLANRSLFKSLPDDTVVLVHAREPVGSSPEVVPAPSDPGHRH